MSYQPTPTKIKGGQEETWVADEDVRDLLKMILVELKISNSYKSIESDNILRERDIIGEF